VAPEIRVNTSTTEPLHPSHQEPYLLDGRIRLSGPAAPVAVARRSPIVDEAQELERGRAIVAALGGPDNITDTMTCLTRLRVGINDRARVDVAALRRIRGVYGVGAFGYEVHVVFGFKAAAVEAYVQDVLDA
jgi:glucose-like phosphotransferase system IIB component